MEKPKNDFGEEQGQWVKQFDTKAHISYNSGNRNVSNNEMTYDYSISFQVRQYHKIDEFDRIYFDNKRYRILSIEKNPTGQYQLIRAELINE